MQKRSTKRDGDFLRICDRTGFTVWASDTRKEWTGAIVHRRFFEARHPQDFLRGRRDDMRVTDPRSEGVTSFVGPLITETTAAAGAGDASLSVLSSARFSIGDQIRIMLANAEAFLAFVTSVPDAFSVSFLGVLPSNVESGAKVINLTAVAEPDLG